MVVTRAALTVVPARSDGFRIAARLDAPNLAGVRQIRVELGSLGWTVALAPRRGRLEYRAPKGSAGLQHIVLRPAGGQLTVSGKRVVLSGLPDPVAVRVTTAGASECATVGLAVHGGRKRRRPIRLRLVPGQSSPCAFATSPLLDPPNVVVGVATEVRAKIAVDTAAGVDPASLKLVRLADAGEPVGEPGCALRDDGGAADAIAGDGVFSCLAIFSEPTEGPLRLGVRATAGGVPVLSAGAVLLVVRPLDAAARTRALAAQQTAQAAWTEKRGALGDGLAARLETVRALRLFDEVQDAGVSDGARDVWIRYRSGVLGVLMGVDRPEPQAQAQVPAGRGSHPRPPRTGPRHAPARASARASTVVGADTVTSWDPGFFEDSESAVVRGLFGLSKEPVFTVATVDGDTATIGSLAAALGSGTFQATTHGCVWQDQVGLMTKDKPADVLEEYGQSGQVAIAEKVVLVLPAFVAHQTARSSNGLAFLSACFTLANDTMAQALREKGFATVFGFDGVVPTAFASEVSTVAFCGMLAGRLSAGEAYDAIPEKTADNGTRVLLSGDRSLVYPGPAPELEPFELKTSPSRMCVGRGANEQSVHVALPEKRTPLAACFEYAWENTGRIGDLEGGNSQTTRETFRTYVPRATVPAEVESSDTISVTARIGEHELGTTRVPVTGICMDVDFSRVTLDPNEAAVAPDERLVLTVRGSETCPDVQYSWMGLVCGSLSTQEGRSTVFDPATGETPCKSGDETYPAVQVEARPDLPCADPDELSVLAQAGGTITIGCKAGEPACGSGCCPASRTCCAGTCCSEDAECVDGRCTTRGCASDPDCGAGRSCCGNVCCDGGEICSAGQCVTRSCWFDFECGGNRCCGTCCGVGDVCGNGFVCESCPGACIGGQCRNAGQGQPKGAACSMDLACCSLSCVGKPNGICS